MRLFKGKVIKASFPYFRARSISLILQGSLDHHSTRALRDNPAQKSKLLLFACLFTIDTLEDILMEEFSFSSASEGLY